MEFALYGGGMLKEDAFHRQLACIHIRAVSLSFCPFSTSIYQCLRCISVCFFPLGLT